jgi:sensor histidine kinase YesM
MRKPMPLFSLPPRAHPLELFPIFRRWRPSPLRSVVYTLLWSSLIGLVIVLNESRRLQAWPPAALLVQTLVASNMVGFSMHGAMAALRRVRAPAEPGQTTVLGLACMMFLLVACTMFGLTCAIVLMGGQSLTRRLPDILMHNLPIGIGVAILMTAVAVAIERRLVREKTAALQQQQIAEAGQLLAEARLRTLQAQIEPHFLYNTLANVVSLIGSEPAKAKHMLERLIDFLRASLSASRAEQATLGAELDLAAAYLDLLSVRMGARLRWRIEADDACRALPIAPMLIQPLVENAIMHGIEPKMDGGEIVVRAALVGGVLRVEVGDDGVGLGASAPRPGGGVGLSNLRERLRSLHGLSAQLQLLENQSAGVTSRLLLPLDPA